MLQIPNNYYCAYQWYTLPPILGARWEVGGELTCPNGTSFLTWGTILRAIPSLHIPYKYPISPWCAQCVIIYIGDMGVWMGQSRLSKYPPLREDYNGKSPSFLQHLPPGMPLTGAKLTLCWITQIWPYCCELVTSMNHWHTIVISLYHAKLLSQTLICLCMHVVWQKEEKGDKWGYH